MKTDVFTPLPYAISRIHSKRYATENDVYQSKRLYMLHSDSRMILSSLWAWRSFHAPIFLGCHPRVLPEVFIEKRQVVEAQRESDFLYR